MSLARKVKAVERLFNRLDAEVAGFKAQTGLGCVAACGRCCTKPNIEATVLEFLPLAYAAYKEGRAYALWEKLNQSTSDTTCALLGPQSGEALGFCNDYLHRGLICRLFGFSTVTGKGGVRLLSTCSTIKTSFPESFKGATEHIQSGGKAPHGIDYAYALIGIDAQLGTHRMPINTAIRLALEHVMAYYSYRRKSS